ncbi:DNA polymerase [Sulfitobacter phage vB_SupP_AX]|nr:DNA polymerase [Sulfitobacter phage vB_SupP_AX]
MTTYDAEIIFRDQKKYENVIIRNYVTSIMNGCMMMFVFGDDSSVSYNTNDIHEVNTNQHEE